MMRDKLPPDAPIRPDGPESLEEDVTLTHTRFSAAPQPRTPISEPRYIHALMFAAWLGRLIDPVDFAHHPVVGFWSTKDTKWGGRREREGAKARSFW